MFVLLGLVGCCHNPRINVPGRSLIETVRFQQLSFELALGETRVHYSDWGRLLLTFQGSQDVRYLNLSVNGRWAIRNVPVLSIHGDKVTQTITYTFSLGVPSGRQMTQLSYGISLGPQTVEIPPTESDKAPVSQEQVNVTCPTSNTPMPLGPATPLVGGKLADGETKHVNNTTFPNQEAGKLECGPVAVSNSLQWLNNIHSLGLKPGDIDIDAMKKATGWTSNGVPADWFKKKDQYMKDHGIPIETTTVPIDQVPEKMDKKCDIELDGQVHIVAIVGIAKLDNGKYSITVRHDTKQGEPGGTIDETVTYDPSTNKVEGGTWLDGKRVDNFVVECPKK